MTDGRNFDELGHQQVPSEFSRGLYLLKSLMSVVGDQVKKIR
jgi:hypothetical protein